MRKLLTLWFDSRIIRYDDSINENKRVFQVGFMRDGEILLENSPEFLLSKFETSLLEEVFLKLCEFPDLCKTYNNMELVENRNEMATHSDDEAIAFNAILDKNLKPCQSTSWHKIKALTKKSVISFVRQNT